VLQKNLTKLRWAILAILLSLPTACTFKQNPLSLVTESWTIANAQQLSKQSNRIQADVEALVNLGPRVTGTPVMEKANAYIVNQFRQAGYTTEIQNFTYTRFSDQGSTLTIKRKTIKGNALKGSLAAELTAPLVVVPNVGREADFAKVNVKNAIAIVRRGEIRFSEKVRNATSSGAVGLIIFNTESGNLASASLTDKSKIPVLGISGTDGNNLLALYKRELSGQEKLNVTLDVNVQEQTVTGRNIIARMKGVTQPQMIIGGHYDSVPGSPGANDNASGTAVVLEMARRLSSTPTTRQVWFVAFDGEEEGLHGSRAFVDKAGSQFLSKLKAMMNFDMVGINKELGIGGTASLTSSVQKLDPQLKMLGSSSGGSDHAPFASAGVPILFFFRGIEPNYHTPNDKIVNPRLLEETTQVGLDAVKSVGMEGQGANGN
jgi:aminopeptidase YwaD